MIENLRKELEELGCQSEAFVHRKLVAVNVPMNVDYHKIKEFLEKGESDRKWTYEESCLSHDY